MDFDANLNWLGTTDFDSGQDMEDWTTRDLDFDLNFADLDEMVPDITIGSYPTGKRSRLGSISALGFPIPSSGKGSKVTHPASKKVLAGKLGPRRDRGIFDLSDEDAIGGTSTFFDAFSAFQSHDETTMDGAKRDALLLEKDQVKEFPLTCLDVDVLEGPTADTKELVSDDETDTTCQLLASAVTRDHGYQLARSKSTGLGRGAGSGDSPRKILSEQDKKGASAGLPKHSSRLGNGFATSSDERGQLQREDALSSVETGASLSCSFVQDALANSRAEGHRRARRPRRHSRADGEQTGAGRFSRRRSLNGRYESKKIKNSERERKRQCMMNEGFAKLRKVVPVRKGRKLTKLSILRYATNYIKMLSIFLAS